MDRLTLEIIGGSLQSVAGEACDVLARTAMSPVIRYCRDCSTAIYTLEGKLAALGGRLPLHPGILPAALHGVLSIFPVQSLNPGDCVITNDPYLSGSPLPQICAISPAFYGSRPLALVACTASYGDVGGSVPGSLSTTSGEIFQEGIRIPPVKMMKKGEFDKNLVSLLTANVRTGQEFMGNLRAQVYANRSAEKRLAEIIGKYGPDKLIRYITGVISHSESLMRTMLKEIPPGERHLEISPELGDLTSGDVSIRFSVRCEDAFLTVDFTGAGRQVDGPFNLTRGLTLASVYNAAITALDPGMPVNDGIFSPIKVITPEGTLVNAAYPAAVAHGYTIAARQITESITGYLSGLLTGSTPAAASGGIVSIAVGGISSAGGGPYSMVKTFSGGPGAKPSGDGPDGVRIDTVNSMCTPVEVLEQSYPILVNSLGLIESSGGPGKFRGGMGSRRTITILGDKPVVSVCADSVKTGSPGVAGGLPGSPAAVSISLPGVNDESFLNISTGKYTGTIGKGSVITIETAGGGGFGSPQERDPELVRRDVLEEFITIEQARDIYGVILAGHDLQVDEEATSARRKHLI